MKKYIPFIAIGILLIIIVVVLMKKKPDETPTDLRVTGGLDPNDIQNIEFPSSPQGNAMQEALTPVAAPASSTTTPPVIEGNLPIGPGCLNNKTVVALIEEWKQHKIAGKKALRRAAIKIQVAQLCPAALNYLKV